mmetsp:Transcript_31281/g.72958  ORF Transcript_31281/g.72958 Transcript_31281/m.72958 type:complete len:289 (-) Transcript_31281:173-1039(-)
MEGTQKGPLTLYEQFLALGDETQDLCDQLIRACEVTRDTFYPGGTAWLVKVDLPTNLLADLPVSIADETPLQVTRAPLQVEEQHKRNSRPLTADVVSLPVREPGHRRPATTQGARTRGTSCITVQVNQVALEADFWQASVPRPLKPLRLPSAQLRISPKEDHAVENAKDVCHGTLMPQQAIPAMLLDLHPNPVPGRWRCGERRHGSKARPARKVLPAMGATAFPHPPLLGEGSSKTKASSKSAGHLPCLVSLDAIPPLYTLGAPGAVCGSWAQEDADGFLLPRLTVHA